LVLSMIRRVIDEFSDIGGTPADRLGARLHKLRGSALIIGATGIANLAADAEAALDGPGERLTAAVRRLDAELQRMAASAAPVLQQEALRLEERHREQALHEGAAPLSDADLAELRKLLAHQNLSVVQRLDALAGGVAARYGPEVLKSMRAAVQDFRFEAALALIDG
jgi:HPt (histidine-containing phosphotransfer) domain-containing protein